MKWNGIISLGCRRNCSAWTDERAKDGPGGEVDPSPRPPGLADRPALRLEPQRPCLGRPGRIRDCLQRALDLSNGLLDLFNELLDLSNSSLDTSNELLDASNGPLDLSNSMWASPTDRWTFHQAVGRLSWAGGCFQRVVGRLQQAVGPSNSPLDLPIEPLDASISR
jgi:hypothetical protein